MDSAAAFVSRNVRALTDTALVTLRGKYAATARLDLVEIMNREIDRRGITVQQQADILWLDCMATWGGTPRD